MPEAVGAGKVGLDDSFEFLDDGEAAFHFSDDLLLLDEGC